MGELPSSCKMRHNPLMVVAPSSALSARIDLYHLGDEPRDMTLEADEAARAAIAAQLGIPAVGVLTGHFRLVRVGEGRVDSRLDLVASVTQTCVVSLEPVEQTIAERSALVLLAEDAADRLDATAAIDPDAPDEIVAEGSVIDLGVILVEQLALALDPYPRCQDAEPPAAASAGDGADRPHPFAALGRLRQPR